MGDSYQYPPVDPSLPDGTGPAGGKKRRMDSPTLDDGEEQDVKPITSSKDVAGAKGGASEFVKKLYRNFASFVRQLNKYDFHKVKNPEDGGSPYGEHTWEFKHPNFRSDMKDSLEHIKVC
ncbi:hypothetical protein P7C70_g4797, partial [Phenoliferia sp. Uapishka_3]